MISIPAFSVQYHPESAAGPHDASYLFERFVKLMENPKIRIKGNRCLEINLLRVF